MKIDLIEGDCTFEHKAIKDGSVDLILTDLPYGTVVNIASSDSVKHGMSNKTNWDVVIDTNKIMEIANRILRKNGKMILFAQQPFTNELINKALPNVPFSYSMIWEKDHFANSLIAKKAPLNFYEDIVLFSKTHDIERSHPLIDYFMSELENTKMNQSDVNKLLSNKMGGHYFTNGVQFCVPTQNNYEKLQTTGFFKKQFSELKEIDNNFKNKFASTFNLWEGKKYKSNILKYKKDYDGYHPTQKPVLLLEDLIKTFSNENDLVADLTMGSGSTAIACMNTKRNFIGIEKDFNYFEVSKKRVEKKRKEKDFTVVTLFGDEM